MDFFLSILHNFLYSVLQGFPLPVSHLSAFSQEGRAPPRPHRAGFSSLLPQLPRSHLDVFLLHLANEQIFSLVEFKIKLIYWQISTAASQVFILKIIIFNSSWLISLKLKLVLWQPGIISQMPARRRAQTWMTGGTRLCCPRTCPASGCPMSMLSRGDPEKDLP